MSKYFEIVKSSKVDIYELIIQEDMNDGDYMYKFVTFTKKEFESDELLQLVLCYLNTPYEYPKAEFGHYYKEDKTLRWLYEYLDTMDMITYDDYGPSHTIVNIDITYYDSESIAHTIKLTSFKELLKDNENLIDYITNLFHKNYDI